MKKGSVHEPLYEMYTNRVGTVYGCAVFCTNDVRHRVRHRIRRCQYTAPHTAKNTAPHSMDVNAETVYGPYTIGIPLYMGQYTKTKYERYTVKIYTNGIRCLISFVLGVIYGAVYRSYAVPYIVRTKKTHIRIGLIYGSYTFRITVRIWSLFYE